MMRLIKFRLRAWDGHKTKEVPPTARFDWMAGPNDTALRLEPRIVDQRKKDIGN